MLFGDVDELVELGVGVKVRVIGLIIKQLHREQHLLALLTVLREILRLDMTIVTIFDHIDSSMREKFLHHIPFGAEFAVDIDYDLVFFVAELVAVDSPVELISIAFLHFLWGYEWIIE